MVIFLVIRLRTMSSFYSRQIIKFSQQIRKKITMIKQKKLHMLLECEENRHLSTRHLALFELTYFFFGEVISCLNGVVNFDIMGLEKIPIDPKKHTTKEMCWLWWLDTLFKSLFKLFINLSAFCSLDSKIWTDTGIMVVIFPNNENADLST